MTKLTTMLGQMIEANDVASVDDFVECKHCNCRVKQKNLKKHVKKTHQENPISERPIPRTKGSIKRTEIRRKYYKCAICKKLITKSATVKHLFNAHEIVLRNVEYGILLHFDEIIKTGYRTQKNISSPGAEVRSTHDFSAKNTISSQELKEKLKQLTKNKNSKNEEAICPVCNHKSSSRAIQKHVKKHHRELMKPTHQKVKKDPVEKEQLFLNNEIHEREYSEDVFDRKLVYQGGAYGLGKNRKH